MIVGDVGDTVDRRQGCCGRDGRPGQQGNGGGGGHGSRRTGGGQCRCDGWHLVAVRHRLGAGGDAQRRSRRERGAGPGAGEPAGHAPALATRQAGL